MNFIRKHDLLKRNVLLSKCFHKVDHFLKGHGPIVVALDQKHRGASATHTLCAPRALKIHATFAPEGAAVNSEGNGALITCSSVKGCCLAVAHVAKTKVRQKLSETR